ncbi:hypothetical protein APHAL10511_004701 [Amanita phalloides]|nr:hypothetical protein APHAL10511_004701 [Amanita phalloides]
MSHDISDKDARAQDLCNGSIVVSTRNAVGGSGIGAASEKMAQDISHPVAADLDRDGEEVLETRKDSLLAEKRSQLEEVYDRHDTLVREVFHMENFRMMLAFDPNEAKMENSRVFQEYKGQFDLLENTAPSSPVRLTRRAHTERRQIIPSISAPVTPSPVRAVNETVHTENPIRDVIERGKVHKHQKRQEARITSDDSFGGVLQSPQQNVPRNTNGISLTKRRQRGVTDGGSPHKHRRTISSAVVPRRSERHKGLGASSMARQDEEVGLHQYDVRPVTPVKRSSQEVNELSEPPRFKIKRIKLIVRAPPPAISHPAQRPTRPTFGSSLHGFLSSYFSPFEKLVEEAALERQIQKEATLLERAYRLRQEGRLPLCSDNVTPETLTELRASVPKRASHNTWHHVVESAIAYSRTRKRAVGPQIAGQIASKVKAYWEAQEAKKEKSKTITEKQLRTLARDTLKIIINEWKKAVFHIREKERLRLEEEERRRGHEHLDAILNQSGYILRTQHGDLTRNGVSRSRSHSAAVSEHEAGEPEEDESDRDEDEGIEEQMHRRDEEGIEEQMHRRDEEGQDDLIIGESETISEVGQDTDAADDDDDGFDTCMLIGDGLVEEPPEQQDTPVSPEDQVRDVGPEHDSSSRQTSPSIATPLLFGECIEDTSLGPSLLYQDEVVGEAEHTNDIVFTSPKLPGLDSTLETIREQHIPANTPTTYEGGDEASSVIPAEESTELQQEIMTSQGHEEDVTTRDSDDDEPLIPAYLEPYAVAPVDWDPNSRIKPPLLLRGVLRPYQQAGLEWLASLHSNHLNGILADEMGLGKTIQTIALLAHLACDRGIWGPHLIIVPTSVLLNWEMEFKKFLPGFKILSYHGSTKRRKELRQGWNDKHHSNVCITSYTLASRDAHIFKRKAWYYMVLDEAHMIKNFRSNRWNTLLMFRSFRRLLLTGTPLQNNLTELWALLKFLMSGANFANLKEFADWFSNPLEKAIEMGIVLDDETMQRVSKLHTVLRPYLLRRLKRDVEKELPSKFEHLVLCPLSKRQRFLYDEFMSRAHTQDALQSGVYQKIANVLMQLRKVCNHPNLFEIRPIVTSFAMTRSAIANFEIKELLLRRRLFCNDEEHVNLGLLGLQFIQHQNTPLIMALETRRLDATSRLPSMAEIPGEPPPKDLKTMAGFRAYSDYRRRAQTVTRWEHVAYLNHHRCNTLPIYSRELISIAQRMYQPILPSSAIDYRHRYMETSQTLGSVVLSYQEREEAMANIINHFAFVTPMTVALDLPRIALLGCEQIIMRQPMNFDQVLHRASVKLQIAFPDPSLLQYDCGKLQQLARLLREKKEGGHRILIFTQMTKVLDILEIFLNFHGYLYLRLDGATKIEDRQYITERFNADDRIFCFISSSRSGGVGINLTGADTVVFYDSDFNPQMDRQCEDRAHRIGQIRDVHIYRFVSQYTVEESMLRKANQKRSLDDLVIQKGEFDWRSLFGDEGALTRALEEFEDTEDAHAAAMAVREEIVMGDADEADFADDSGNAETVAPDIGEHPRAPSETYEDVDDEQGGTTIDYMITVVERDYDFFKDWRI